MKLRIRVGKGPMPIAPPGAWIYNLPMEWGSDGEVLWVMVARIEPGEVDLEVR